MLRYEQEARLITHTMALRKQARELNALVSYVEKMPDFIASHWQKETELVMKTLTEAQKDVEEASEYLEQLRGEINGQ